MREELEDNHYIQQSWLEEEKLKSQEAVHQAKAMLKVSSLYNEFIYTNKYNDIMYL